MIKKQFIKPMNINSLLGGTTEGEFLQVRIVGNEDTTDLKGRFLQYIHYVFEEIPQRINDFVSYNSQDLLESLLSSDIILEETKIVDKHKILTILYHRDTYDNKNFGKLLNVMTGHAPTRMKKINNFTSSFKQYAHPIAFETPCPALNTENKEISIEFSAMTENNSSSTYILVVPKYTDIPLSHIQTRMKILEELREGNLYIKASINPNKEIISGGKTYVTFYISDDVLDFLNTREPGELFISDFEFLYNRWVGEIMTTMKNGTRITKWKRLLGKGFKYTREKGILIAYDGEKAKDETVKYITPEWKNHIDYLTITQYSYNTGARDYYLYPLSKRSGRIIYAHHQNVSTYYDWEVGHEDRFNSIEFVLNYINQKKKRVSTVVPVRIQRGPNIYGEKISWVVPYEDSTSSEKYLTFLTNCLRNLDYSLEEYYAYYKSKQNNVLQEKHNGVEDMLENWYKSTLRRQKEERSNVSRAYIQMRNNLINEQRLLKDYLKAHDFSKLNPVPKIAIDEKTLKNYYKTLHIEPKDIIINTINNKKINPIRRVKGVTKIMFVSHGKLSMKIKDLDSFYDRQMNCITFNYSDLKGAIKDDKA